ncbi:MAG: hypothetical protein DRN11_02940 [Thermoplasmata archaeon]|nr:MAG: hypothetical protein DRN11_02940 [Thermoplasmata archaeon]
MKKFVIPFILLCLFIPNVHARVDAKFKILDFETGRQIYMKAPDGKIIYGNVLVGQKLVFDGTESNSIYPIKEYRWDLDGDGEWDREGPGGKTIYSYDKPGIYNVTMMVIVKTPDGTDADKITHPVVVVEKLLPPVAIIDSKVIYERNNVTIYLNGSASYDPDGYIHSYGWDLNGDGKWDKVMVNKTELKVNKNGYYTIVLTVYDYDLLSNSTTKIFKIDKLDGNLNESIKTIEIINKLGNATDVKIVVNNCDVYNLTVEKEKAINISINPDGLNEIDVFANGKERAFLINATSPVKIFIENEIYMGKEIEKKTPGFEFILLLIALLLFAFRNR